MRDDVASLPRPAMEEEKECVDLVLPPANAFVDFFSFLNDDERSWTRSSILWTIKNERELSEEVAIEYNSFLSLVKRREANRKKQKSDVTYHWPLLNV